MSELEETKKRIVEIIANMPSGKVERADIFRIIGTDREMFNQAFQELKDEYSISEGTIDGRTTYANAYELTSIGIDRYSLKSIVDETKLPDYVGREDSEYIKVVSQDTQYDPTTTGVRLATASSELRERKRKGIIFISAFVIVAIVVAVLIVVFVL